MLVLLMAATGVAQTPFGRTNDFNAATNGSVTDPYFHVVGDNGFGVAQNTGRLIFGKTAGISSGTIKLASVFRVMGDFSAYVDVFWDRGNNIVAGLAARTDAGSVGIHFVSPGRIYGFHCFPGDCNGGFFSNQGTQLFISRSAGIITCYSWNSGGWEPISNGNASGPATIEVYLTQEHPEISSSSAAASCSFDDLRITAADVEPLPAVEGIQIHSAVEICVPTLFGVNYQMQRATSLATPQWQDWGNPFLGTGSPYCTFDAIRDREQGYYRAIQLIR
jgi:hypothetical protein